MGESRSNPRSPAYNGPPPKLPDMVPGAVVQGRVIPNEATLKRLQALAEANGGQPYPVSSLSVDELDYVAVLCGQWGAPSRLVNGMPAATIELMELGRMPLAEFKARAAAAFKASNMPDLTAPADAWTSSLPPLS